ncbi:MAG: N-formylglutamate amidohydrolase [Parvibaculum sp.]
MDITTSPRSSSQEALESSSDLSDLTIGGHDLFARPFEVLLPRAQRHPFVFCSPHSGRFYPQNFVTRSRLDPLTLRRSEDSFVEEIFAGVVDLGAPLLHALFPRAYLDANREPYELDPTMFRDALPPHANTRSLRVAGGLGTIARIVADAAEIYREPLAYAEADRRIRRLYMPFHAALRDLLERTHHAYGLALLIDCHSMPSVGGPADDDTGTARPDIVLGDRYGTACAREFTDAAEASLKQLGYSVARNNPYAGGFNTEHYGQPALGFHALQIEINRALYMDEAHLERRPSLARIARDMSKFAADMASIDWRALRV